MKSDKKHYTNTAESVLVSRIPATSKTRRIRMKPQPRKSRSSDVNSVRHLADVKPNLVCVVSRPRTQNAKAYIPEFYRRRKFRRRRCPTTIQSRLLPPPPNYENHLRPSLLPRLSVAGQQNIRIHTRASYIYIYHASMAYGVFTKSANAGFNAKIHWYPIR